jgi:hypothetical protein
MGFLGGAAEIQRCHSWICGPVVLLRELPLPIIKIAPNEKPAAPLKE